jgi:hypothetical protein
MFLDTKATCESGEYRYRRITVIDLTLTATIFATAQLTATSCLVRILQSYLTQPQTSSITINNNSNLKIIYQIGSYLSYTLYTTVHSLGTPSSPVNQTREEQTELRPPHGAF